jgi:hypothetical protein
VPIFFIRRAVFVTHRLKGVYDDKKFFSIDGYVQRVRKLCHFDPIMLPKRQAIQKSKAILAKYCQNGRSKLFRWFIQSVEAKAVNYLSGILNGI